MATPKREEVEAKAMEKVFGDQHSKGCKTSITPTTEELKESGHEHRAGIELMQNEESLFLDHLEKEAHSLGYTLAKTKIAEGKQRKPYDFEIDIEEALRSGVFISGGKGTTKTNLAILIADMLIKKGITVKVFDISQAWKRSSIPNMFEIGYDVNVTVRLYESAIFDLSRLTPKIAKEFISKLLANEWNTQIDIPEEKRKPIVYVFEEVQALIPQGHLRSNEAQYVLRLMTSGRNFKLGYVAITQRPALTDTSVFELTFQRYFARMDGQNDLKKVANYIGIDKARELQKLKLGEFFYDMGNETKWIKTEEFKSRVAPRKVVVPKLVKKLKKEETKEVSTLETIGAIAQIGSLLVFVLMVMLIALGV